MSVAISKQTLLSINDILSEQMGLRFPENRLRDLERGLLVACKELNLEGVEGCLDALRNSKLSREQVELLASHLTIGETYFFRDPKSLSVLEKTILPELIDRRRSTRILRIWSAGCSTGEEIYSLAILLQRLIPNWREWGITLLGTDINPAVLRKAEAGIYGAWSFRFRNLNEGFKQRYFRRVEGKRYQIREDIRRMARFAYLNLAESSSYPSLATNTVAMDVILCRNVMIYFSKKTREIVTARFFDSLIEGGWVLTSPSEASAHDFSRFETLNFPGAIFFRKSSRRRPFPVPDTDTFPDTQRLEVEPPAPSLPDREERRASLTDEDNEPTLAELERWLSHGENEAVIAALTKKKVPLPQLEILARAWANRGNLPKALSCCQKAIAADPTAARFHYLKAGVLQEMGDRDAAVLVLRKAIFLERNFIMAHFTLANLYRQRGDRQQARRHFHRADELLVDVPSDESPPEGEGMNAGRLRQIVAGNLRLLDE